MPSKWKIGLMASLLLTPAIVVAAESNAEISQEEQFAIEYFSKLTVQSPMSDYSYLVNTVLQNAFPTESDKQSPNYQLMKAKIDYIVAYQKASNDAYILKADILKLSNTSKTLFQDVTAAEVKYNNILLSLQEARTAVLNVKNYSPAYDGMLTSISSQINLTPVELIATFIDRSSQDKLAKLISQVQSITNSGILTDIENLYNANGDNYYSYYEIVNAKYAALSTEERTIVDNQVVPGTNVTMKTVVTKASDNIAKAKAFDQAIRSIESIKMDGTDEESIQALKAYLIKIDVEYNKLSALQKQLINDASKEAIAPFQTVLAVSSQISALKPAATLEYRAEVQAVQRAVEQLEDIYLEQQHIVIPKDLVQKIVPKIEDLKAKQADIAAAESVEVQIEGLKDLNTPSSVIIAQVKSAYNALTSSQKKLVMNYSVLTSWEKAEKNALAVDKKIDAIVISATADFPKKYNDAKSAYEKLNQDIDVRYVKKYAKLMELKPYAEVVQQFTSLKTTDANYTAKVKEILAKLEDETWSDQTIDQLIHLTAEEKASLKNVRMTLLDNRSNSEKAADLINQINQMNSIDESQLIYTIIEYRAFYESLDASTKKLVTNITKLADYEKLYKNAISIVKLVVSMHPTTTDFVKNAQTARKNFDKLPLVEKSMIAPTNEQLVEFEKISNVMHQINELTKSKNILQDALSAEENYKQLLVYLINDQTGVVEILQTEYLKKLDLAMARHREVSALIEEISRLELKITPSIGQVIDSIAARYKKLSSNDKKNVVNYQVFKQISVDYKAAEKVSALIEAIPSQESADYPKKVEVALNAYRKLTSNQARFVFNYDLKLKPYIAVAALIGDINALKTSDKDLAQKIADLRARYNALSNYEKSQIYNYNKLEAAEAALKGADAVVQLIRDAKPGIDNYLELLQKARDAYDALSSDQKKQVTNYQTLVEREKAVKPVLQLNDLIIKIAEQTTAKNFISNYEKAWKEYEKISLQDRKLLTNESLLRETYTPLYTVMKRIESIKNSSNSFVADVKAARDAYNALSKEQQAKILNYELLKEHEINVAGGAYVDELIRQLKNNPKEIYVAKVLEAEDAYKKLSSSNKKAVTLYDELKAELNYVKPVIQAIDAINVLASATSQIDSAAKKVDTILAKLTDDQLELVTNLDKLNNMQSILNVVKLIELIKPSDTKYYIGNTKAAELAYNRLSPDEKSRVTNYSKLEEALINIQALDQIIKKISELSSLSETFRQDVAQLMSEYKALPSALKKHVSNYSLLDQANKDIAAAEKVEKLIAAIDPNSKTFESKVTAALSAFEKLTKEQQLLVANIRLLRRYQTELGL